MNHDIISSLYQLSPGTLYLIWFLIQLIDINKFKMFQSKKINKLLDFRNSSSYLGHILPKDKISMIKQEEFLNE